MSLILKDTFQGVNGTALNMHTPDVGGPWTIDTGTPTIEGNKLHIEGAASARVDFNRRLAQVSMTFDEPTFDADGALVLYLRETDNVPGMTVELLDGGVTKIFLNAGAFSVTLNPGPVVALTPTGNVMRFLLGAGSFKAWLNGILIGAIGRSFPATTKLNRLSIQVNDADSVVDVTEIVAVGLGL